MAEVNEAKREKSQVEDINRSLYDFRYEEKDAYKVDAGLTPAIVEQISREKNDPDWMLELRLKSLEIYNKTGIPEWGPPIDELNMDDIITYVRPNTKMSAKWSEVPTDIKDTFEKLGLADQRPIRYLVVCRSCGQTMSRMRRSALVEHPERYRCRCGGTLEVRQVGENGGETDGRV